MRIQILNLPSIVVGDDVQEPFALVFDQADDSIHKELWASFAHLCGAKNHIIVPQTVEIVDRYAEPTETRDAANQTVRLLSELKDQPEPASLPPEVRTLIHAVDRMRDNWAEADVHVRYELWMAVHDASDAVYQAYRESPIATLTAGWPRLHVGDDGTQSEAQCIGQDRCAGDNCPKHAEEIDFLGRQRSS